MVVSWCCARVQSPNDIIQKIEKTLDNTHTTEQKQTNNIFGNTKKHPFFSPSVNLYSSECANGTNKDKLWFVIVYH